MRAACGRSGSSREPPLPCQPVAASGLSRGRKRCSEAAASRPALAAAFPDAEVVLAATAQRAHEAQQILREVAEADAAAALHGDMLDVADYIGNAAAYLEGFFLVQ